MRVFPLEEQARKPTMNTSVGRGVLSANFKDFSVLFFILDTYPGTFAATDSRRVEYEQRTRGQEGGALYALNTWQTPLLDD